MFEIPVFLFGLLFAVFLLVYIIYSLFNILHLLKYGHAGIGLYVVVTVFTFGSIFLIGGSLLLLAPYDWTFAMPVDSIVTFFQQDIPISL